MKKITRSAIVEHSAEQIYTLVILSLVVASLSWTVTQEEVFREFHDYCAGRSQATQRILERKFFYLFTCEYCFSHYVTVVLLIITKYTLLFPDWRGYLIAGFSMVWIANIYMSLYNLIRIDLKKEKIRAEKEESELRK